MGATFRIELHITCDSEECVHYPRSEVILDQLDMPANTKCTLHRLKHVAKSLGWHNVSRAWQCPLCRNEQGHRG